MFKIFKKEQDGYPKILHSIFRSIMEENIEGHFHPYRCIFGCVFMLLATMIFASVIIFNFGVIKRLVCNDYKLFLKFLFCIASSLFGFGFLLLSRLRFKNEHKSFPREYMCYYPVLLIFVSAGIFSLLGYLKFDHGIYFYTSAFTLCAILGYLADNFWKIITGKFSND